MIEMSVLLDHLQRNAYARRRVVRREYKAVSRSLYRTAAHGHTSLRSGAGGPDLNRG